MRIVHFKGICFKFKRLIIQLTFQPSRQIHLADDERQRDAPDRRFQREPASDLCRTSQQ